MLYPSGISLLFILLVNIHTTIHSLSNSIPVSDDLCASSPPLSYVQAKLNYPLFSNVLNELSRQPIATWYTDRPNVPAPPEQIAKNTFFNCSSQARPTIIVYGMPNKDCEAHFSSDGSNKNSLDYKNWLEKLANVAGQKPVIYILEPDAIGLLADGKCGNQLHYKDNLRLAMDILTKNNPNADLYLDIGYWTLSSDQSASQVAAIIQDIVTITNGSNQIKLKGIALNTSNFRSIDEMIQCCKRFIGSNSVKSFGLKCVVDTSRNFCGPSPNSEWCNPKNRGIGMLPQKLNQNDLHFETIDYYLWLKPPGESDGSCDSGRTQDAMKGPIAGDFFQDGFKMLWNNGIYVINLHFPTI